MCAILSQKHRLLPRHLDILIQNGAQLGLLGMLAPAKTGWLAASTLVYSALYVFVVTQTERIKTGIIP